MVLSDPWGHDYRKYKTTFPVALPPAPSYTRLSPAPPNVSLIPRWVAGRAPCRQHAGRRCRTTLLPRV